MFDFSIFAENTVNCFGTRYSRLGTYLQELFYSYKYDDNGDCWFQSRGDFTEVQRTPLERVDETASTDTCKETDKDNGQNEAIRTDPETSEVKTETENGVGMGEGSTASESLPKIKSSR